MDQELLKKNFEGHGFKTSFFRTKEAAAEYLASGIEGKRVAMGGSMTLKEMGIYELLEKKNEVIWHWVTLGEAALKKAREAQIYLTSANAASETGELVNIDGTGNRVSQTVFGPEKTYFIIGKNKICTGFGTALWRGEKVPGAEKAGRPRGVAPRAAADRGKR